MWIAIKPFRYRGKRFNVGDKVPASSWPSRRALEIRRKIRFVSPNPATVTSAQLKKMTRAELNVHASKVGIEDPEDFPNRESLLQAIDGEDSMNEEENVNGENLETDDSEENLESDDPGDEDSEDSDFEEDEDEDDEDDNA